MEDPINMHPTWAAAPTFLKELVLLLDRMVPDAVRHPVHVLKAYSPCLHAAIVAITILTLFFILYVAVHVSLYRRLATHYPILQVLFKGKWESITTDSKATSHGTRDRTRGSSTQYRGSKFAGSRNVRTPKAARSTPLSATATKKKATALTLTSSTFIAGGSGEGVQIQTPDER